MRTSIHSYVWVPDWTTENGLAAAERAVQFGFDHLVVPLRDHATVQPERLAREFSRLGIVPLVTSTCVLRMTYRAPMPAYGSAALPITWSP